MLNGLAPLLLFLEFSWSVFIGSIHQISLALVLFLCLTTVNGLAALVAFSGVFMVSLDQINSSKHLKGRLGPRVSNSFGSHTLGRLSVTVLARTLLAGCQ